MIFERNALIFDHPFAFSYYYNSMMKREGSARKRMRKVKIKMRTNRKDKEKTAYPKVRGTRATYFFFLL